MPSWDLPRVPRGLSVWGDSREERLASTQQGTFGQTGASLHLCVAASFTASPSLVLGRKGLSIGWAILGTIHMLSTKARIPLAAGD